MMFLLASPLQETETGEPSASTATASSKLCYCQVTKIFPDTSNTKFPIQKLTQAEDTEIKANQGSK
jgi:hypothetical protein